VLGTAVAEEWILWADEKTVNLNYQRGMYPRLDRDRGSSTKLYYCYYTQSTDNTDDCKSYACTTSLYISTMELRTGTMAHG